MKTGQSDLFIPGPTNVPEDVRRAMNVPMQDMRAPDFGDLTLSLFTDMKRVLRTDTGSVFFFPGSGTGACDCGGPASSTQPTPPAKLSMVRRAAITNRPTCTCTYMHMSMYMSMSMHMHMHMHMDMYMYTYESS